MRPAREMLKRMRKKNFYGGDLELEVEPMESEEAFGFTTMVAGGTMRVRSIPKYEGKSLEEDPPVVQHGEGSTPERQKVAGIQGRFIRMLDMTSEEEPWVQLSMQRLVAELVLHRYERRLIVKALHKVKDVAWVDCRGTIRFVDESEDVMRRFRKDYDEARERQSSSDVEKVKKELEMRRR